MKTLQELYKEVIASEELKKEFMEALAQYWGEVMK